MKRFAILLLISLSASAQAGDRAMTGAEFAAAAEGRVLFFTAPGDAPAGAEGYLTNGRTVWLPPGGVCEPGLWREDGDALCFFYPSGRSCWRVYAKNGEAWRFVSAETGVSGELFVERSEPGPLLCPNEPGS